MGEPGPLGRNRPSYRFRPGRCWNVSSRTVSIQIATTCRHIAPAPVASAPQKATCAPCSNEFSLGFD